MTSAQGTSEPVKAPAGKTPYGIFLAVMTVFSLITAAVLAVNWAFPFVAHAPTQIVLLLEWVDVFFCGLFLVDWFHSVVTAKYRLRYLFGERPGRSLPYGVLELFGTVPFSFFFRLLRLFRLRRMGWHLSDLTPRALYHAVVNSRTESALLLTGIVAFLVLVLGSIFVLLYEHEHPTATIDTANDALWWALVTITTVGYGDQVPITPEGRFVGAVTMVVGIGIFGVIAGSMASLFTSASSDEESRAVADSQDAVTAELAALRAEVAELRHLLQDGRDSDP